MASRLELLREASRLLRDPTTIAEGAVLKSLVLGDPGTPEARAALEPLRGQITDVDPDALAALPAGTFGRTVAEFFRARAIAPLRPSPLIRQLAQDPAQWVPIRYAMTHDLVHVLLGEDTDFAGEAAVYAFSCGQRYARSHWAALTLACVLWPLLTPHRSLRIWGAVRRGWRKGRAAPMILAAQFESRFAEPLDEVRRSLGLDA